jgi:hypothetical protein
MKTYIVALFAGAMLTSAVFAAGGVSDVAKKANEMARAKHTSCRPPQEQVRAAGDPWAEERFRIKYGRNTPAEEARQKAVQEVYAKNIRNCEKHGCGQAPDEKAIASAKTEVKGDPGANERFRMKFGRTLEEMRLGRNSERAKPMVLAAAGHVICEAACCDHHR